MNVLVIVNVFPRISETFILDQMTYLLDHGFDIMFLSYLRPEDLDPPDDVVHGEVATYRLMERVLYFQDEIGTTKDWMSGALSERLREVLTRTDVIVSHFANTPTQIAEALAERTGVPYVFTSHARDLFVRPDAEAIRRYVLHSAAAIVPTEFNKTYLLGLIGHSFEDKVHIVRYGIDTRRFSPCPRPARQDGKLAVLTVGRFVEKKGTRDLILAFSLLCSRGWNAVLRIIGDGPLKREIAETVAHCGLEYRVEMLGYRDHASVLAELKRADVFALPSRTASDGDREGLPVSILEAAAMGLPVVSTVHTGIPEGVIDGKTGFLVSEGDVTQLAHRLEVLLRDGALREEFGMAGREHIMRSFDLECEMSKLTRLIESAGARRVSARSVDPSGLESI